MTTSGFLDLLIHSISNEDWQKLNKSDPSLVISQWNLKTLQRMREYRPVPGDISVEKTEALRRSLSRYLDQYMSGKPDLLPDLAPIR